MTHAAEGLLQAYIDGEVEGSAAAELDLHITRCAECAAELDRLRTAGAQVAAALALLDVARGADSTTQAWWRVRHNRGSRTGRLLTWGVGRAAALLLVAAGVASAALPGSPVREAIAGWLADGEDPEAAAAPGRTPAATPETPATERATELRRAEMTVLPVDGRVRVLIWAAANEATVRVNFVPGERVSVQAGGEEGEVRFRSGPGRIEVYDLGAGHAVVNLPSSLAQASIEVDGRQFLYKEGDQLRTPGPMVEQTTQMIVFRVQK
jgi:anti-sigma factor RsiW